MNYHYSKQLITNGIIYGYPKCCIESFVDMAINHKQKHPIQISVSNNTGFIPCFDCSLKVYKNKCELKDLIQNRLEILPFPKDEK